MYVLNNFLKFERKIYQIFNFQLGRPIRLKAILYFFVIGAITLVLINLPIIKTLIGWIPPMFLFGIVVGLSWLLADVGTEGRNPLSFFKSFIAYKIRKAKKQTLYRGRYVSKPSFYSYDKYVTIRAEKFPKGAVNLNAIALHDFAPTKELEGLEKLEPIKHPLDKIKALQGQTKENVPSIKKLSKLVNKKNNDKAKSSNKNTEAVSTQNKLWGYGLGIGASLLLMVYVGSTYVFDNNLEEATKQEIESNNEYEFIEYEYEQNDQLDEEENNDSSIADNGESGEDDDSFIAKNDDSDDSDDSENSSSQNGDSSDDNEGVGGSNGSSVDPPTSNTNDEHTYYTNGNGSQQNSDRNNIASSATDNMKPNSTDNRGNQATRPPTNKPTKPPQSSNGNGNGSNNDSNTSNNGNNGNSSNKPTSPKPPNNNNGSSGSTPTNPDDSDNVTDNPSNDGDSSNSTDSVVDKEFTSIEDAWNYIDNNMIYEYLTNGFVDWEIERVQKLINAETKEHKIYYQVKWLLETKNENSQDLKVIDTVDFKVKTDKGYVQNNGNLYRTLMALEKDLKHGLINEMSNKGMEHWWVRKVRLEDGTARYTVDFYENKPTYQIGNTGKIFETKQQALSWVNDNYDAWFEKGYTILSVYSIYDSDTSFTVNFRKVLDIDSVANVDD